MQAFGENNEQPRGLRLVEAAMQGVEEAELSLKSATRAVDQYAASFDFDAKGYEELSARAAEVSRLLRRHGCRTCEELLSEVENAQARLEEYYDLEGQRGGLEAEIDILREELKTAALEISATRRAAAARLKGSVEECLKDLGMGGACFAIDVRWEPLVAGAAPTGSSSSLQFEVKREESAETKVPPEPLGSGKVMARATREAGLDKVEFLFAAGQQVRPSPECHANLVTSTQLQGTSRC